jgi:5-methylthioribose kinase
VISCFDGVLLQTYKRWLLTTIRDTWIGFEQKFQSLWTAQWENPGDALHADVYKSSTERNLVQKKYMKELLHDTLGFAAAKMIR